MVRSITLSMFYNKIEYNHFRTHPYTAQSVVLSSQAAVQKRSPLLLGTVTVAGVTTLLLGRLGAVAEHERVDLVFRDDVRLDEALAEVVAFLDEVGTVEHGSTLLHLGGHERARVEPLSVLERAVGAEFQEDVLPVESALGVRVEAHDLLLLEDLSATVGRRFSLDLCGEDGATVSGSVGARQDSLGLQREVEGLILGTVGTVVADSVSVGRGDCGIDAPQAVSQSFHCVMGFELGDRRFLRTRSKDACDTISVTFVDGGGIAPLRVPQWGC